MQLTPIGCAAGMPSDGVASSGYLLADGGTRIMLDCGPGTAVGLSRSFAADGLDALFVSHLHTDHVLDVLAIGKMVLSTRLQRDEDGGLRRDPDREPVPLFAPKGAAARFRALAAIFPVTTHPLLDAAFEIGFAVHEYEHDEEIAVGPLRLRFALLEHAEPDHGIRVDGPTGSLTYSGDTRPTPALTRLAEGTGALLVESTLRDSDPSAHGHLASWEAGRAAREADARELVLTHMHPLDAEHRAWHRDRAAEEFDGPVALAEPFVDRLVPAPLVHA